jgi:ribokinase
LESASFPDFDLLLLQLEIPTLTVLRAAQLAKENGVRVILNPAPAKQLPNELIALADFIIPNETELTLLTNFTVDDIMSAELAARILLNLGAQYVIVTLGSRGALAVTKDGVGHIPAFKVDVVDTTAAGDAFIGGFATALLQNKPIDEAISYGCACGALAITKFGAQPSLPTKKEAERFLSSH